MSFFLLNDQMANIGLSNGDTRTASGSPVGYVRPAIVSFHSQKYAILFFKENSQSC
jgi:hypothetical protein